MDNNIPLLFDPPHVLPPDVVLTQSINKCENCGKVLGITILYFYWNSSKPSYSRSSSV